MDFFRNDESEQNIDAAASTASQSEVNPVTEGTNPVTQGATAAGSKMITEVSDSETIASEEETTTESSRFKTVDGVSETVTTFETKPTTPLFKEIKLEDLENVNTGSFTTEGTLNSDIVTSL